MSLQGVNLKIRDGERMALVGQSGAGKSTVIELISRFYDVQEGEVLIGGINVNELNYDTILKNIAIVFQKTFLTRDSVLENIRMGFRRQPGGSTGLPPGWRRLMTSSCRCRMVMTQR